MKIFLIVGRHSSMGMGTHLTREILQRNADLATVDDVRLVLCVVEFGWKKDIQLGQHRGLTIRHSIH